MSGFGLSRVSAPMLELLLTAIERGRIECPLTPADLGQVGLLDAAPEVLGVLAGVSRDGAVACLRVALAEREHRPPPRIDLVWTGPETKASTALTTALCVERLFNEAQESVIVGGYSFDRPEILEPLHRAIKERGVSAMLFMEIDGTAATAAGADAHAKAFIERFFTDVWTFGPPRPDVYYDPRTTTPGPPWASLHAKCIVIDDSKALVTSANFTDRGQTRNIETGVAIVDDGFARQLAGHWRQLIVERLVAKF